MNLWDQLVDYFKQVIAVTRRVDGHDADIEKVREENKAMQAEMRRMADKIRDLEYQVLDVRKDAVHEREKLLLRLDNMLIRAGVSPHSQPLQTALPPPED